MPTRTNTFAGADLDRAAARRADPAWLERALADPGARAVLTVGGEPVVTGEPRPLPADDWDVDALEAPAADAPSPLLVALADAEPLEGTAPVLLGVRARRAPVRGRDGRRARRGPRRRACASSRRWSARPTAG